MAGAGTGLARLRERLAVLYCSAGRLSCGPAGDGGGTLPVVEARSSSATSTASPQMSTKEREMTCNAPRPRAPPERPGTAVAVVMLAMRWNTRAVDRGAHASEATPLGAEVGEACGSVSAERYSSAANESSRASDRRPKIARQLQRRLPG